METKLNLYKETHEEQLSKLHSRKQSIIKDMQDYAHYMVCIEIVQSRTGKEFL